MARTSSGDLPDLAVTEGEIVFIDRSAVTTVRASVLIRDGSIVGITPERRPKARETISADGMLVLPGFVNAHCHSIHLLLRGWTEGRHYHEWLEQVMYRALPHYRAADARVAAQLFCAEAIRSGITTIADSTDFGNRPELVTATLAGIRQAGLRSIYFRTFSDSPPPTLRGNHESIEDAMANVESLIARHERDPLTAIGPGINEPHFVSPDGFFRAVQLAQRHRVPIMAHVAEVKADAMIDDEPVVDWLLRHQLLSPRLVLAHCVWLRARDFRRIARAGASVTWQPSTNAILADGVMPIRCVLDCGVNVGLGTDDSNVNDHVNMFSEMRTAALLTKIARRDATAIAPHELLFMATLGGAMALGLQDRVGSIAVGKRADLMLLRRRGLMPLTNLASALVYQASGEEVDTVVVNGRVVMRQRVVLTVDEPALRARAQRCATGVLHRSGLMQPLEGVPV